MPSQSQYTAETPTGDLVPKSIVNFFERFFKISDSPEQHEEYAGCFTEEGVMVHASSRIEGREGNLASFFFHLNFPYQIFLSYDRICPIARPLLLPFDDPRGLLFNSISSFLTPEHPGIFALRHKMWESVSSRSHHLIKIFPFGKVNEAVAEAEVMMYGTVDYGFKAGGNERKEWAARAELVSEEGDGERNWAMRFYQVYVVSLLLL